MMKKQNEKAKTSHSQPCSDIIQMNEKRIEEIIKIRKEDNYHSMEYNSSLSKENGECIEKSFFLSKTCWAIDLFNYHKPRLGLYHSHFQSIYGQVSSSTLRSCITSLMLHQECSCPRYFLLSTSSLQLNAICNAIWVRF